ncbi:MAG: hypothetical protein AB8F74_21825, partial [Saprospiraceae bacterium]
MSRKLIHYTNALLLTINGAFRSTNSFKAIAIGVVPALMMTSCNQLGCHSSYFDGRRGNFDKAFSHRRLPIYMTIYFSTSTPFGI